MNNSKFDKLLAQYWELHKLINEATEKIKNEYWCLDLFLENLVKDLENNTKFKSEEVCKIIDEN